MRLLQVGDIVMITWLDHYRYRGKRPTEMIVQSWGKVDEITAAGVALLQNEVLVADDRVDRIMDGQFILTATIIDIQLLKNWQKASLSEEVINDNQTNQN